MICNFKLTHIIIKYIITTNDELADSIQLDSQQRISNRLRKRFHLPLQNSQSRAKTSSLLNRIRRRRYEAFWDSSSSWFYKKNKNCWTLSWPSSLTVHFHQHRAITELGRGVFQASNSYLRTHQRFFDYPINTLSYPIAQHIGVGFVRSSLDRQKLYDWITNMVDRSIIYGQTKYSQASKESIAD